MSVADIAAKLACGQSGCACQRAARAGRGKVHCPSHADARPSFSVTEKNGKLLVKCFSGCEQADVIAALRERGLWPDAHPPRARHHMPPRAREWSTPSNNRSTLHPPTEGETAESTGGASEGLTLGQYAEAKRLPVAFLRQLGLADVTYRGAPAVHIPYQHADGTEGPMRFRLRLAKLPGADGRFEWKKGSKLTLYGLDRLQAARQAGRITLVEGESDAQTLWHHGEPAIGLPGANTWNEDRDAAHFDGIATVYVVIEPDTGGAAVRRWLATSRLRDRVRLVELGADKDPSGVHVADPDHFTERWQAALATAVPWADLPERDAATDTSGTFAGSKREPAQAARALPLLDRCALFHGPDGEAFTLPEGAPCALRVRSRQFREWLAGAAYRAERLALSDATLSTVAGIAAARARFDGDCREVFVRVGGTAERTVLDLGDASGRAVVVDAAGWQIVAPSPVMFVRPGGLQPLPVPERAGTLDALRPFLNIRDDDLPLIAVWLVTSLRPRGPYPLLDLAGEQGSGKSTTARVLQALIDPRAAGLRAAPRDDHDLAIGASNSWVLALDNLSAVPGWLSDALCRLSTGGGFSTRELYADRDETLFDMQRPAILTGIPELATRADLLDRALVLDVPGLPDHARRPESDFWADFAAVRPRVLGALLDALAAGLARLPATRLHAYARLADFERFGYAAAPALGFPSDTFLDAYARNRREARGVAIEAIPYLPTLRRLAAGAGWQGSASFLLGQCCDDAALDTKRAPGWPKDATRLARDLKRLAPALRADGINISFIRSGTARSIVIAECSESSVTSVIRHELTSPAASPSVTVGTASVTAATPGHPARVPNDASGPENVTLGDPLASSFGGLSQAWNAGAGGAHDANDADDAAVADPPAVGESPASAPPTACPDCGRSVPEGACFACGWRPCVDCGSPTGSTLRPRCSRCGLAQPVAAPPTDGRQQVEVF